MNDHVIELSIGALFIFAGGLLMFTQIYRNKFWIRAIGSVIHIRNREVRSDGKLVTEYSGTFAYRLPRESELHEFDDDVWQSPCRYQIGEEIEILINPNKPKQAWVKHGNMRVYVSGLVVFAGVILLYSTVKN